MSFFLEDDDPYSQEALSQSQQFSQVGLLSQGQSQFHCDNCGGTDSYQDAATGQTVCSDCYTQSQQATQETGLEYEDIMGLAAKTRGGALVQRAVFKKTSNQRRRVRQPLETLDSSVPLPSLDVCLQGMQCVLRKSAKILCKLAHLPEEHVKSVDSTVKRLWIAYLRAFADGAEHYGRLFPHVRLCVRDRFISHMSHRAMLLRQLAYKATQEQQQQQQQEQQEEETVEPRNAEQQASSRKRSNPFVHDSENEDQESEDEAGGDEEEGEVAVGGDVPDTVQSEPHAPKKRKIRSLQDRIMKTSLGKRLGYKEAALLLKLDMKTAAVFLWLAVSRSGVTSAQMCRWIASGHLPLLRAFRLLTPELQRALKPITYFFRIDTLFTPTQLEAVAVRVAVACRYKPGNGANFVRIKPSDERLRFWTEESLPLVVASYVEEAGLDQDVLDRALALMGLQKSQMLPLEAATPDKLTCPEDILAVVAAACQLDPKWRSWAIVTKDLRSTWTIPWNEKQLRNMTNGPRLSNYLDFVETHFLCKDNLKCEEFAVDDEKTAESNDWVPPRHNVDDSSAGAVRPSPVLAGALAVQPVVNKNLLRYEKYFSKMSEVNAAWTGVTPRLDAQQLLLIEFLAHTAQADAPKIEQVFVSLFHELSRNNRS